MSGNFSWKLILNNFVQAAKEKMTIKECIFNIFRVNYYPEYETLFPTIRLNKKGIQWIKYIFHVI